MSPRGLTNPHRYREFLAETEGDPWWDREEQALVEIVQRQTALAQQQSRTSPSIVWTVVPNCVHLSSLPEGWRLIVGDTFYVPQQPARAPLWRRLWQHVRYPGIR